MTQMSAVEEFVRHLRVERGLSQATWTSYRYQVLGYLRFLEERRRGPGTAARDDILAYLEARKDAGLAGSTVFAAAVAIRLFHRFLAERGLVAADPATGLKLPKYRQRLPDPLTAAEMEKLLGLPTGGKFHLVRMKAALELLYSTGMRVSELLGIGLDQLRLEEGWVRVLANGRELNERYWAGIDGNFRCELPSTVDPSKCIVEAKVPAKEIYVAQMRRYEGLVIASRLEKEGQAYRWRWDTDQLVELLRTQIGKLKPAV